MTETVQRGLRRIKSIIAPGGPIPVSRSCWWAGVKSGRFPKPLYLGRITVWREADIQQLIENGAPRAGRSGDRR